MPDRNEELETLRKERAKLDARISMMEGGDGPAAEDASAAGDVGDLHDRIAAAERRGAWLEAGRLKTKLVELTRKEQGL